MSNTNHIPTPWILYDASSGIIVANRLYESDAAHIVKCVNAHDELVRATEGALDAFAWHADAAAFQPSGSNGRTVVEELRAALAKV